jgi:hypothetical protein
MSHSRQPIQSLAVLPVVNAFVFLFRSGAFAHQEVVVALTGRHGEREAEIRQVTRLLGGLASGGLAVVAFTPLADVWFQSVSGLTPEMTAFAIPPMRVLLLLPGLEYLLACQRGLLILARRTRVVTAGTAIEAAGIGAALLVCVGALDLVGALAAAVAMMTGRAGANTFLATQLRAAQLTAARPAPPRH